MISFSNPKPKTWQEFSEWMRGLKIDNIEIDHDYLNDTITVRNKDTRMNQRISRFVLDHMDPELRQETFLQMIANTMKNPQGGITTTGAITQGTYTISSGGSTNLPYNVSSPPAPWNVPPPVYVDDYYRQQKEQAELAKKLFSTNEHALFQSMKRHIWDAWERKRNIEEQQTWNRDRMVIAGGCFTSMITGDTLKDYDVFLLDDDHNRRIAEYMATKHRERDDIRIGGSNYMDNSKIEQTIFFQKSKFQYITTKYKTREELIDHFDFKHCRVSYDLMTEKLFITRETMDLILKKELDPSRPDDPPKPWRYEKFQARGWKMVGDKETLVDFDFDSL
jgi:hypothetical protein